MGNSLSLGDMFKCGCKILDGVDSCIGSMIMCCCLLVPVVVEFAMSIALLVIANRDVPDGYICRSDINSTSPISDLQNSVGLKNAMHISGALGLSLIIFWPPVVMFLNDCCRAYNSGYDNDLKMHVEHKERLLMFQAMYIVPCVCHALAHYGWNILVQVLWWRDCDGNAPTLHVQEVMMAKCILSCIFLGSV